MKYSKKNIGCEFKIKSMIEKKPKPCKGIGKAKGVQGCNKLSKYRKYGLCHSCLSDWLLNTDAGKLVLEKATLKAQATRLKIEKELKQGFEEKKNRSSLSKEIEKTQKLFNKYIRLRDQGKLCISQNIPWKKDFDAGHAYSVKQYNAIRFNYDNCHGQSIYANRYLEGDYENYLSNLPNRIGEERTKALKQLADDCKKYVKKWSIPELKEIQKDVSEKIKNLNKR